MTACSPDELEQRIITAERELCARLGVDVEQNFVELGQTGRRVRGLAHGQGPAVLLLHGGARRGRVGAAVRAIPSAPAAGRRSPRPLYRRMLVQGFGSAEVAAARERADRGRARRDPHPDRLHPWFRRPVPVRRPRPPFGREDSGRDPPRGGGGAGTLLVDPEGVARLVADALAAGATAARPAR